MFTRCSRHGYTGEGEVDVPKWEQKSDEFELEVTSDNPIPSTESLAMELVGQLLEIHAIVPLTKFELERKDAPLTDYDYHFESVDGRHWRQVLRILPTQVLITFDVVEFWDLADLVARRALQDSAISLARKYGVSKIEAKW